MSGNTFGKLFTITTFGESHGPALGCIIDGCPPGLSLAPSDLQGDLNRRKPGQSRYTTQRKEDDEVQILSGVFEGKTTGTPIGLLVHNQDQKSSPYSRFSASVNLGSSSFFRESQNQFNVAQTQTNTFSSSVNYSKKFVGTPFNMNLTATHQQNTNTGDITMTLPSLTVNMDRQYPFVGKGGVKKNPLQKLGFNYTLQGQYLINTNDEDFLTAKMFESARSGVQHRTSTNTNIKAFKYFTISPSASYEETWQFDYINKKYDAINEGADNKTDIKTFLAPSFTAGDRMSQGYNLTTEDIESREFLAEKNLYDQVFSSSLNDPEIVSNDKEQALELLKNPDAVSQWKKNNSKANQPSDVIERI